MKIDQSPDTNGAAPLLWNVGQVASSLGISERSVWRFASAGILPKPMSIGRSKRWDRRTIEAVIEAKKEEK